MRFNFNFNLYYRTKKIVLPFKFSMSYTLKTYIHIKGDLKDSCMYISSFLDLYSIPLNKVK